jgi:hypothetical protein
MAVGWGEGEWIDVTHSISHLAELVRTAKVAQCLLGNGNSEVRVATKAVPELTEAVQGLVTVRIL